jgi:hypothetical protein
MRFGQYMPGIRAKTSVRGKEFSVPVIWMAFPVVIGELEKRRFKGYWSRDDDPLSAACSLRRRP